MTAPSTNPAPLLDELQALGAPAWYLDAVGAPQGSRFVPADDGTPLHLVEWNAGEHAKPALLLLHGYRANTHAWDAIAPFLTSRYRVSALDWPGMGCSGHRRAYGDAYAAAADLPAAMDALGGGPVTVVAHSFGGSPNCRKTASVAKRAWIAPSRATTTALTSSTNSVQVGLTG